MTKRLNQILFMMTAVIAATFFQGGFFSVNSLDTTKTYQQIKDNAELVTVLIAQNGNSIYTVGSGVIIIKDSNYYTVLTAAHIFDSNDDGILDEKDDIGRFLVKTPDGDYYKIRFFERLKDESLGEIDLVLLQFISSKNYKTAKFLDPSKPIETVISFGSNIYVSGFSLTANPKDTLRVDKGKFSQVFTPTQSEESFANGYNLEYKPDQNNQIDKHMSGGPIFDDNGDLIGIHGRQTRLDSQVKLGIGTNIFWDSTPLKFKNKILLQPNNQQNIEDDLPKQWEQPSMQISLPTQ